MFPTHPPSSLLTKISVFIDGIAVVTLLGQTVPNWMGNGIWVQEGFSFKVAPSDSGGRARSRTEELRPFLPAPAQMRPA